MRVIFLLLASYILLTATVEARRYDSRTDEQKAADKERSVRNSELRIGPDCEPVGFELRFMLKTYDPSDLREFWVGQRYAVERTYQAYLKRERLTAIDNEADRRILEIEEQRDAAILSQNGVGKKSSEKFDSTVARIDESMDRLNNKIAKKKYDWYVRCSRVSGERSRR